MRLLLFSDLHGDSIHYESLRKKARDSEAVINAGDLSHMGLDLSLMILRLSELRRPVISIHGNHEGRHEMAEACSEYDNMIFLHKGVHMYKDLVIMGYGGGGFTSVDAEFSVVANKFFRKYMPSARSSILVTHAPPFRTRLDLIGGEHHGNKSIRQFIEDSQPTIAVCGHLHENFTKTDRIGQTMIVNPGPSGVIVDV